jgi:molybdopterin synthase sulfur carrier subunit
MPVTVHVPTPLRRLTAGQARVEVVAGTVSELLTALEAAYPGMAEKLLDENGAIRRYVNLYVNDEDIRFLQGTATPLADGDAIAIVPAIAGG